MGKIREKTVRQREISGKGEEDMELGITVFPTAALDVVGYHTAAQQTQTQTRKLDRDATKSERIFQRLMEPTKVKPIGTASLACLLASALFFIVYASKLNLSPVDMVHGLQRSFGLGGAVVRESEDAINLRSEEGAVIDHATGSDGKIKMGSKLMCETWYRKTNVCAMEGDVRVHGNSSSVIHLSTSGGEAQQEPWLLVKPYPRKNDKFAMNLVRELQLRRLSSGDGAPRCTVHHSVPGIVFSTGGYAGNYFHDFSDLLFPLFLTSWRYDGDVQFLVTDMRPWWMTKYRAVLDKLTRHDIIDFDGDDRVHCFKKVTVGLIRYDTFSALTYPVPKGSPSLLDFCKFLRSAFSLGRHNVDDTNKRRPPRLLIVAREKTRRFANLRNVVKTSRDLGYKVVTTEGGTSSVADFARVVNSCDVMLGVHGAGLTNMVFLPVNATVIQVVPWGHLEGLARYSFLSAVKEMELRYLEYGAGKNESSLVDEYPKDHPVLNDVDSIRRQGWNATRDLFLKQDIRVDVAKLRAVLLDALRPYRH